MGLENPPLSGKPPPWFREIWGFGDSVGVGFLELAGHVGWGWRWAYGGCSPPSTSSPFKLSCTVFTQHSCTRLSRGTTLHPSSNEHIGFLCWLFLSCAQLHPEPLIINIKFHLSTTTWSAVHLTGIHVNIWASLWKRSRQCIIVYNATLIKHDSITDRTWTHPVRGHDGESIMLDFKLDF